MICPMGIHISPMIGLVREALAEAGLQPAASQALSRELAEHGTLMGIGPSDYREAAGSLAGEGIDLPLDKPQAEIMVLMNAMDVSLFRKALAATAQIILRKNLAARQASYFLSLIIQENEFLISSIIGEKPTEQCSLLIRGQVTNAVNFTYQTKLALAFSNEGGDIAGSDASFLCL